MTIVNGELYNFGWSRRPARTIRTTNQIYVILNDAGRSSAARYHRLFAPQRSSFVRISRQYRCQNRRDEPTPRMPFSDWQINVRPRVRIVYANAVV